MQTNENVQKKENKNGVHQFFGFILFLVSFHIIDIKDTPHNDSTLLILFHGTG